MPATVAYEHLSRYLDAGGTQRSAARICGVSVTTLKSILTGREAILADTRDKILSLPMPERPVLPAGLTYKEGTVRRLHALHLEGWRLSDISAATGVAKLGNLHLGVYVTVETAAAVAAAAEWMQHESGPSAITSQRARAAGWHPMDSWPDIDDPDCRPVVDDGDPVADDWVVIEEILAGRGLRYRPACFENHHIGRRSAACLPCARWRAHRDEAIRAGSVPKPYGPGLSMHELAELTGDTDRTVSRVRERYATALATVA